MSLEVLRCGIIKNWFKYEFTIDSVEPTDSSGDIVFELRDFSCNKTVIRFDWRNYPFLIENINRGLNLTKSTLPLFENGVEVSRFTISSNKIVYEANINWFQEKYKFNPCAEQFKLFEVTGNVNYTVQTPVLCSCPPDTLLNDCPPDRFNTRSFEFQYGVPEIKELQIQLSKGLCCEGDISVKTNTMPDIPGLELRGRYLGQSEELELPCIVIPSAQNQTFTLIMDYNGNARQFCALDVFNLTFESECKGRPVSNSIGPIQIKAAANLDAPCSEPVSVDETQFLYRTSNERFILRWNTPLGANRYLIAFFNAFLDEVQHPNFTGLTNENNLELDAIENIFEARVLQEQEISETQITSVVITAICEDGLFVRSEQIDLEIIEDID